MSKGSLEKLTFQVHRHVKDSFLRKGQQTQNSESPSRKVVLAHTLETILFTKGLKTYVKGAPNTGAG